MSSESRSNFAPGQQVPQPIDAGMGRANTEYETETQTHGSSSPLEKLKFKFGIGDKKTRDGQAPKRRGPKPDSKPALTRRQELNRQAQRTHRERKENYMRALEIEVDRLRKAFKEISDIKEENRRLKEILAAHGIQYDLSSPQPYTSTGSNYGGSSTSLSGRVSHSTGHTSPPSQSVVPMNVTGNSPPAIPPTFQVQGHMGNQLQAPNAGQKLDYEDIGLDFVGTLEQPCIDHKQFLVSRSYNSEDEISGHALMATVPPIDHVIEHPDEQYPHKMPEMAKPDLIKMLNLCAALPIKDEVTPVMAWAAILSHPRCVELTIDDFNKIKDELKPKVRCYGFGAVLEDFEIRDALASVLASRGDMQPQYELNALTWNQTTPMEGVVSQ